MKLPVMIFSNVLLLFFLKYILSALLDNDILHKHYYVFYTQVT
jgi:hypothetical protein